MNIEQKKPKQLAAMQTGGTKLAGILKKLIKFTQVGTSLIEIDALAQKLIAASGGKPGFMTVEDYQWATCININDGVVHGIPNRYVLQNYDVISIDIGLLYQGFHTDMSYSFQVVSPQSHPTEAQIKQNQSIQRFLQAGKEALNNALKQVKPGRRVGHLSQAMQQTVEKYGYHCVTNLTGHGIGRQLHEYPAVPCVVSQDIENTPTLKVDNTLAVEVIYVEGEPRTYTDTGDGWTIRTTDGKIAGMFEKTIAVSSDGYLLLTP